MEDVGTLDKNAIPVLVLPEPQAGNLNVRRPARTAVCDASGDRNSGLALEEAPVLIGDARQLKFEDRGGGILTCGSQGLIARPYSHFSRNQAISHRLETTSPYMKQLDFPICNDPAGAEAGADDF